MWAPELNPSGLTQGDILVDVPVGATKVPLTFLASAGYLQKNQQTVFRQYDTLQPLTAEPNSQGHFLSKGRITRALVITHSCDLDDLQDTERVLVAPIAPAANITDAAARQRILEGKRATFMPLPGVPTFGDCYADLRSICPLDRNLFTAAQRHCSMTDEALLQLQAHLAVYFTRIEPEYLVKALQVQMFDAAAAAEAEEKKP